MFKGTLWIASFAACLLACSNDQGAESVGETAETLRASGHAWARFDPNAGQLPEGLALHKGNAYVTFAPLAEVAQVDPRGRVTTYATLPPANGAGYTLGLAFVGSDLLVAQSSFDPSTVAPGIYRVPAGGGHPSAPWATHPAMTFPNGLTLDHAGKIWVADSTGAIFTIDAWGQVSEWTRDPLLVGDPSTCGYPLPIGANGIVVTWDSVWVTSTARGALVRIPIQSDGSAGAAWAALDDCTWAGADGLARGEDGSLLFTVNAKNEIVRYSADGSLRIVSAGAPLDFPASIVKTDDGLVVTNAAFFSGGWGAPSVLRLDL